MHTARRREVGQQEVLDQRAFHVPPLPFSVQLLTWSPANQKSAVQPTQALDPKSRRPSTQLASLTMDGNTKQCLSRSAPGRESLNSVLLLLLQRHRSCKTPSQGCVQCVAFTHWKVRAPSGPGPFLGPVIPGPPGCSFGPAAPHLTTPYTTL